MGKAAIFQRGFNQAWVWSWPAFALVFLLGFIVFLAGAGSPYLQRTVTAMLINVCIVVGFYLFVGNSGIFSFGHISFVAIGAYVSGLLTIAPDTKHILLPNLPAVMAGWELSTPAGIAVGGLAAAAMAAVLAVPLMRMSGIGASIATLGVLIIVIVVIGNLTSITGGLSGMLGLPLDTTMSSALLCACIAIAGAYIFQRSGSGLLLRASREDVAAATSLGINIWRERSIAFVLSAFLTGLGGGLFGHFVGAINPDAFYVGMTVTVSAMLIIGGVRSLTGAVLGTILVSALTEILGNTALFHLPIPPGVSTVALATLMLGILIFRPQGITSGAELKWVDPRGLGAWLSSRLPAARVRPGESGR